MIYSAPLGITLAIEATREPVIYHLVNPAVLMSYAMASCRFTAIDYAQELISCVWSGVTGDILTLITKLKKLSARTLRVAQGNNTGEAGLLESKPMMSVVAHEGVGLVMKVSTLQINISIRR